MLTKYSLQYTVPFMYMTFGRKSTPFHTQLSKKVFGFANGSEKTICPQHPQPYHSKPFS